VIRNSRKYKIPMGPMKLKPVSKQDEATKLWLKQLKFINIFMKINLDLRAVSYFSSFSGKAIIL
jgi:hypothetical protein